MSREMIINASALQNVRVAVVFENKLEAFFEEFQQDFRTKGNIYLGQIINVENSLDACFVDYGESRHGFLPLSEIMPQIWQNRSKDAPRKIDQAVKRGQKLLVQVDKEASGSKGARLTTQISLAGRYLVIMPDSETRGVSRRIEDPEQRREFKKMTEALQPPKNMGLIVRTAGMGQNKRDLSRDMSFLLRLWKQIQDDMKKMSKPGLLHADADLIQRILRDYYSNQIDKVWIDDALAMNKATEFFRLYMPRQKQNLKAYTEPKPIFSFFGVESQLDALHARRVELPSGGSLVIDSTEALVAIDVNSGKTKNPKGQEETAKETNLEAAAEIGRQLRLRDLGGIIVIDFIDMQSAAHNRSVERALREAMKPDKARSKLSKISAFGLCTLTRQRLGKSTHSAGNIVCPTCNGNGVVRDPESTAIRILRQIKAIATSGEAALIRVRMSVKMANFLQNQHRAELLATEREYDLRIQIEAADLAEGQEQLETSPRSRRADNTPRPKQADNPPQAQNANAPANHEPAPEMVAEPTNKKKRKRRRKKPASETTPDRSEEQGLRPNDGPEQNGQPAAAEVEGPGEMSKTDAPRKRRRRRKKKPVASSNLKTIPD